MEIKINDGVREDFSIGADMMKVAAKEGKIDLLSSRTQRHSKLYQLNASSEVFF